MKTHLSFILRLVVAIAGLGYIGWVVDWTDKLEIPAGTYTLAERRAVDGRGAHCLPYLVPGVQSDLAAGQGGGVVDAKSTPPSMLAFDSTADLERPGFRVRPGLLTTLAHARLGLLLLGLLLVAPIYPITAVRWWMLLRARGLAVPVWQAFRLTMVGCFFNYCMPGSTGGDVIKAYYAAKNSSHRADSVMTVIVDRVVGLLGLILLAGIAGLFILGDPIGRQVTGVVWLVMAGVTLASAFYFSRRLRRRSGLDWLLGKLLRKDGLLDKVNRAALAYSSHKSLLLLSILMSLPVHFCLAVSATFTGHALGMSTPASMLMSIIPVLFFISSLPISYQGFGLMEYFALRLLLQPGLATTNQIVVMLVVIRLYQVFYSVFGSVFVLGGRIEMHPERRAQVRTGGERRVERLDRSGDEHVHQATDHDIEGDAVVAALGDDEIGPALARLDELQVHRPHRLVVLLADLTEGAAARLHVAADAAEDADVGVGVDEDLDVEAIADPLVDEDQDALDDDDRASARRGASRRGGGG